MSSSATFGWSAGVAIGGITLTTLVCQFAGNPSPLPMASADAQPQRRGIVQAPPPEYMEELRNGLMACFSQDGPPTQAAMDDVNSMYFMWDRYNASSRWTSTASGATGSQGDAATLLWSLVPDTVSIPAGVSGEATSNSQLFSRMDTLFAAQGGRATWVQQFVRCFARYQSLSGVNYVRVTATNSSGNLDADDGAVWSSSGAIGLRGDVRISMHPIDGVNGILAYNSFPGSGNGGNMVMDSGENWSSGSTGNTPYRFFRNTVMHEHGHGLGFAHVCPSNGSKLMEPFLSTSFDGPQQDDIRAVQRQYGDPYEPNNSAVTGFFLGTLGTSSGLGLGATPTTVAGDTIIYPNVANGALLSIDANAESDYWSFDTSANVLVTIAVTPIGSSYSDLNQDGSGSDGCTGGTGGTTNALAISNLVIAVVNSAGSAGLALSDVSPVGTVETLPSFLLTRATNYKLRITESDSPTESQLYKFTITVLGATSVTASDGASSSVITLSWTNIPGATQYQVYRGTTNDFNAATQIATPATNSYNDSSLPGSSTFFYWVKATQVNGGFTSNQFVGGPEQGSTGAAPNTPPTANAGLDQNLHDSLAIGSLPVTLNGSLSSDSDGSITNYKWTEGVTTLATGPSSTANISLPTGVHNITLTVTDDDLATGSDTVVVTVTSNQAPVADAGSDQSVLDVDHSGGEVVNLDGSLSTDPNGTISSYVWTEGAVQIATGPTPSLNFPVGVHTVTLTVTDNETVTDTDTVVITVTSNQSPIADAGSDQTVTDTDNSGSEVVNLNGTLSSDPDGSVTSYVWTEGAVEIATGPTPAVSFAVGSHSVTLTVTDNLAATATDTVLIRVDAPPSCPADFDGDGTADFFDYDAFVICFEGGACPDGKTADFDGDGTVDFFDYDAFVVAFEAGC